MVAVVAGNGLGLLGTSLQQLGLSPGGQSSLGQSGASQYVNIATGNLILQSQDERLVEQGLLAGLVRTYNSLGSTDDFSNSNQGGWLLGLDRSLGGLTGALNTVGSSITRDGGDGEEEVFTYDSTRELYVASNESGASDTLQQNADGTWTYTVGGRRNQEIYNSNGQLTKLLDASTGASYTLQYSGWFVKRLATVIASDGEALEIAYDAQGRVSSLSTLELQPDGSQVTKTRVSYAYDGTTGLLASVTTDLTPDDTSDNSAFTTSYTYYDGTARIKTLSQSDGLTISYTYDDQNRIASVQTGNGEAGTQKLSFSYDTANGTTTVKDAANQAWVYTYDPNGNLTSITSPLSQVTCYAYTTDGHLASVTDALNKQTVYEYDARGNRILERDADGNTIKWTYNDDDQVLTRTVYQAPDPDGEGPGQASVPSTTWYVYGNGSDGGADQLRYVIDADGNVSETQYNTNGQVSLTRSFAGAAYDTGSVTDSTCPTLSQMETWKSSQDLTQTTRVDYSYDTAGRLSQKIAWDTINPDGSGQGDNGESITQYVYDAQGLLRQQVTVRGSTQEAASYSYDGMGRLIGSTDAMGGVTTYAYSGDVASGSGTLTITQSIRDGVNRVRTEARNSAGELVTVTESASDGSAASRTTHYTYDAEGQLRAVQDPSGAISYTFYDEAGRISGTVDAMGAVTQCVRDADGNIVETKQYATAVDTTTWLSNGAVTPTDIAAIAPTASPDDRTTLSLYDAAGQHVADVDALGDVTTYVYDGAGNLTTTTQYATALSTDQLNTLQGAPSWSTLQAELPSIASARINRTFYDVANRAVATLDAAGDVTTTAYDAAGRVIRTTAFATALDLATVGNPPSLSDVVKVAHSGDDQTIRYFYDNRGQLVAKLDADGYLTTTAYDETANTTTTTRYANQLTGLTGSETLADLTADVTGSAFQTSINQYDADGRLSIATAVDGTVTNYVYDKAGNLLSSTATPTSDSQDVREIEASYDAFGDVLSTTDGTGKTSAYTYNALGQKVLSTDALGNNTWFFYDADGRLVYTVRGMAGSDGTHSAQGEVTVTTYNALGEAASTTRYAGLLNLTSLGLNASTSLSTLAAAVASIASPATDHTETFTYTLAGQIATALHGTVESGGNYYIPAYTDAYSYDAFGDLIQTQQQLSAPGQALAPGNSVTTTYSYDVRGERTSEVDDADGLNRTTGVTYDAFGRVTSRTDGNGHITTYNYDALGRQISVGDTVQGTARTTHTTYDAYGRILATIDALGQTTTYSYSPDTHTVTVTTPDGVTSKTTKDAFGETVSVEDGTLDTTSYAYDKDGRLLTRTDALGNIVLSNSYDDAGNLVSTTDGTGVVTAYTYDATGRVLTRTVDAGDSTHLNLITQYAYDGIGQQVGVTGPNGGLTTYSYDADGNVLTVVKDAGAGKLNLTTTYTWDGAGHQLTVVEDSGDTTHLNRTTQYAYDNLGRLTSTRVDPDGLDLTTRYAYDANNNLVAKTDAGGNVTRYVYDEANELIYTLSPSGPTTAQLATVTQNWYDVDGHLTSTRVYAAAVDTTGFGLAVGENDIHVNADDANDRVSYTVYNEDGAVAYKIDPQGYVTEFRYDATGRIKETLAYADAISVSAQPGLQSALQTGVATVNNAPCPVVSTISSYLGSNNTDQSAQATLNLYDADGRAQFVVRQNTVNGQLLGVVTEKRYDAAGRVVADITYGTPLVLDTTSSLANQLSSDSVSQSLSTATDLHQTRYVYDNAGRLRYTIDAGGYVSEKDYDRVGNVTDAYVYLNPITVPATLTESSITAAVSATNTSASTRQTSNIYDDAGRLITVTQKVSDTQNLTQHYAYDATGLKTSYTDRTGATWTYIYDNAGRLVEQDSPMVAVSGHGTISIATKFGYDANGNVTSRTEAVGIADQQREILYSYDRAGHQIAITYPSSTYVDGQGNTATGTTTSTVTYNALGQAVVNRDVRGNYEYKIYNADGQLAYEIDGNGYLTAYGYDAYGNQVQITRYAGALNFATAGWTPGHALTITQVQAEITHQQLGANSDSRVLTTTYDQLNRKIEVDQPGFEFVSSSGVPGGGTASPITTYTYDAYGNIVATSMLLMPGRPAPDNPPVPGEQQVSTQSTGEIPPVWAITYDYYDARNQKTLEVDPMGYVTTWSYNAAGDVTSTEQWARAIATSGLTTTTRPATPAIGDETTGYDRTTDYTYDDLGRKVGEQDEGGHSSFSSGTQKFGLVSTTTTIAYDGEGRVTSVTTNAGSTSAATTRTTYDALGRVLTVTEPQRLTLTSGWETALTSPTPPLDLSDTTNTTLYIESSPVTTFVYDAFGNAVNTTRSAGAGAAGGSQTTLDQYDALRRLVSETDANGTVYTNAYDAAGNLRSTTYTLDANGNVSSTVQTTYHYDADNQRLDSVTKRGGTVESATYVKYNAFGEVVAKGDGVHTYSSTGYELTYQYDNAGNLISATDPKTGAQHSYQYDLRGNLVYDTTTITGGTATVYVENQYDEDGRVISQLTPSAQSTNTESSTTVVHSYDRWGNVLSTEDAGAYTTTYEYDSQNHLVQQTEPLVMVVAEDGTRTPETPTKEWYYDGNGRLVGATDENGHTTTNTYDPAGELVSTTDAVGAITYYAYDGLGRQVGKQTPPINNTSLVHITWRSFDALNRVIQQGDFLLEGSTLTRNTQESYVLDQNGNRLTVKDALNDISYYSYDSQGRVLTSQTPLQYAASLSSGAFVGDRYAYDINGNKIKETTAVKNSSGQYDTESWLYDYFGRVRQHTDLGEDQYAYNYDSQSGLLTSIVGSNISSQGQSDPSYVPGQDAIGNTVQSYTYYADGQIEQILEQTDGATTTSTSYRYDEAGNQTDQNTQTLDGAGGVVDTDIQTTYDSHGRIAEVTQYDTASDPDSGIMRTVYNYDAAGNRRAVFVQSGYGSGVTADSPGPTITSAVPNSTVLPGTTGWHVDVASHFNDTYGFGLTYTITANDGKLPGWMHFTNNGELMESVSELPQASGSWTIKVIGTDINGHSASTTFTVTVPVVNPAFHSGLSDQIAAIGHGFNFTQPMATDANGPTVTLSYTATLDGAQLPDWLVFDPATCTFSGTPPAGTAGTHSLQIKAAASTGTAATETFNFVITSTPPTAYGTVQDQTLYPGREFSFSFPTSLFITPDGQPLSFSAGQYTIERDDSGPFEVDNPVLPDGMSFYYSNDLVVFTGTLPAGTPVPTTYKLYIQGRNADGAGGTIFHFNVTTATYVPPPPTYNGGLTAHTAVLGQPVNIGLPANTFTDDGNALTYTAQVLIPAHTDTKWNATKTEPMDVQVPDQWVDLTQYAGLSINATSGTITGSPSAISYVTNEISSPEQIVMLTSYTIRITATNSAGTSAAGTFTLSNSYAPPVLEHAIPTPPAQNPNPPPWGSDAIKVVPDDTFSNPYGDNTYTAVMANGSQPPSGLWLAGQYVTVTTVPAGTYIIKVTATNKGGSTSASYTLTVNNVAPTIGGSMTNLTAVKGSAMGNYTAPMASDLNGDALTYSATGMPPGVTFNTSTRTFSGTPTATGTYTVTYKASDGHLTASKTFTITVSAPANQPPVYNGGIGEIELNAGQTDYWQVPSTAFTNPTGRPLSYSMVRADGTALGTQYTFSSTGRLTSNIPSRNNDFHFGVILTATDTTDHMSVSVSTDIYITGSGGGMQVVPAGGGMVAETSMSSGMQTDSTSGATMQTATTQTATTGPQAYWFTYDANNRVDISGGELVDGQIQLTHRPGFATQGTELEYDKAGNVVTELSNDGVDVKTQTFVYDARGEMIRHELPFDTQKQGSTETRQYDAAGRLIADVYYLPSDTPDEQYSNADGTFNLPIAGWMSEATLYYYDRDGRVTDTVKYGRPYAPDWNLIAHQLDVGTITTGEEMDPPGDLPAAGASKYGLLDRHSQVSYTSYDAEGNAKSYLADTMDLQSGIWTTTSYSVNYIKKDGYLEQSTQGTSSDPNQVPTTDTSVYDAFGRRVDIVTHSNNTQIQDQVRAFAYDANGQVLERRDGTVSNNGAGTFTANGTYGTQHYTYANGQQIGSVDEAGDIDVLSGLTAFSNGDSGTQSYVVQAGDTLQSIAQTIYGDQNLWYVVADANSLAADGSDLTAGQTLKLPQVKTTDNTANTFKPYNPNEIQGSTTPSLPQAPQPPPSDNHCKANLALIVIAVVVCIVAPEIAPILAGALGGGVVGAVAGGFLAGVAADAAGQVAADSLGLRNGFSWKEAEVSGISMGVASGVGVALGEAGGVFVNSAGDGLSTTGEAVAGAATYVGTYEGEKLVGVPAHFSWAGLVANAAGAAATSAAGLPTSYDAKLGVAGNFDETFEGSVVDGAVTREVSKGLGDDHVQSWGTILEDAFGNALGNAAIAGIQHENQIAAEKQAQSDATFQQMEGNFSKKLQGDIDAQTGAMYDGLMANVAAAGQAQLNSETAANEVLVESEYGVGSTASENLPHGTVTVGPLQELHNYSPYEAEYQQNANLEAEQFKTDRETISINAERQQDQADALAYQKAFLAWQDKDSLDILKFEGSSAASGATGALLSAGLLASSPWIVGGSKVIGFGLSAYGVEQGQQNFDNGHPIIGSIQMFAGALGATTFGASLVGDAFDGLNIGPMYGSPAAQTGNLNVSAFIPTAVTVDGSDASVTGSQWLNYFANKYGAGNVTWAWPANDGFVYGADTDGSLESGLIGRVGSESGKFASPVGTDPGMLSLSPETDLSNYNVYRIVKPIPGIRMGPAAPAFDMTGYGTQFKLPKSVSQLIQEEYLERVTNQQVTGQ